MFIFQLDSYEVNMKFDIVSYASKPREIVSITNDPSDDVDYVLRKLKEFSGESMLIYYYFIVVFLLRFLVV